MSHVCNIFKKMADFSLLILWLTLGKAVLQGVVSGGLYYDCRWNRQGEYANVNKYITFIKKNSLVRFMFFVSSLMSKWFNMYQKIFHFGSNLQKKVPKTILSTIQPLYRVSSKINKQLGLLFCLNHSLKSMKG